MVAAIINPEMPLTQHLLLNDISWDFYQSALEQLGSHPVRITYFEGRMELVSPLPEHDNISRAIAQLIQIVTEEHRIKRKSFGSSTFANESRQAGVEPDECFYLAHASAAVGMKRFDPSVYPPPDLAVEVEFSRRVLPRLPIFAAIGVPEIWRWSGGRLHVLLLKQGQYVASDQSEALPMIDPQTLSAWVRKLTETDDEGAIASEFRAWCRTLK